MNDEWSSRRYRQHRPPRRGGAVAPFAIILPLLLLVGWGALAVPPDFTWDTYRSPGFIVYVPDGSDIRDLGPTIEDLYADVSHIWLPNLVACEGATPQDQALRRCPSCPACWDPGHRETYEIAVPEGPSCVPDVLSLFLYPSLEALDWDLRNYNVSGLFTSIYTSDPEIITAFDRTRAHQPAEQPYPCNLTLACAYVSGFPDGSWKDVLAHEFTHLLQTTCRANLADFPVDPRLILEGMATVTEYRLGFLDSFGTQVLEPAAHWIQSGGSYDAVPNSHIMYEAGAALVNALCERIGPPALWELFSPLGAGQQADYFGFDASDLLPVPSGVQTPPALIPDWTKFATAPFKERLSTLTGLDWNSFMDDLIQDLRETNVSPAGLAVYEWERQQIGLRVRLLRPVLCAQTLEELGQLGDRIRKGEATVADVDRADALLREPLCDITEANVDELAWRAPSLEDQVRRVQGYAAVQPVIRLSTTRTQHPDEPEIYVAAFADIVNNSLPWPELESTSP